VPTAFKQYKRLATSCNGAAEDAGAAAQQSYALCKSYPCTQHTYQYISHASRTRNEQYGLLQRTPPCSQLLVPTLCVTVLLLLLAAYSAARAVLEATSFQVEEVLRAMRIDSGVELRVLKVDGGMTVNTLLLQFQVRCCY
jgi:FGGY family of carbohydrate kinases, C-terminal domain